MWKSRSLLNNRCVVKKKDQHNSQKNREGNKQANHELSDLPRILSTFGISNVCLIHSYADAVPREDCCRPRWESSKTFEVINEREP